MKLTIEPPTILNTIHIKFKDNILLINKGLIRIRPYPPSLSNTPAKIIEPLTGASTCAFGNHKCTINIGIFTRNAKTIAMPVIGVKLKGFSKINKLKSKDPKVASTQKMVTNKGREANNV
jgi:hypothetical protein